MPEHDKFDVFMKMLQIIEKEQEVAWGAITEEQQIKALGIIHKIEGNVFFQANAKQETTMGDRYKAGQAGAMGPNATATGNTFQQMWQQNQGALELPALAKELEVLRNAMKQEASNPEHDVSIGAIAAAETAAAQGDGPKVLEHLGNAGKWALDVSTKVGVDLATAALKSSLGL